ncbi:hypothetical protein BDY19DRAFT_995719 [Irpex rosettiformis]|uniref:Uncharacterized protein n=1 Tax=Irpex rosettiformis TaxID=378272 RepID=A0ACB8TY23_9APHY|nr:hypothetical protein BDY19DRAFT_995719 [Irpex rosettiformis]
MTRRGWTTEEQRAWLKWFEQFPEPEPTAEQVQAANGDVEEAKKKAIQKRKTQIVNWFQNHNRGVGSGASGHKVLPLCRSQRNLLRWQAYVRLHGKRVMPEINKEWEAKVANGEPTNKRLSFVSARAAEMLAAESQEVQTEVENFRKGKKVEGEGDEEDEEVNKVNMQQRAIDNVPRTLQRCLDDLAKLTGWIGTILVGGPDPRSGSFKSFSYHVGKTVTAGSQLDQATECWGKLEKAFEEFLPKCYGNTLGDLHQKFTASQNRQGTPEDGSSEDGNGENNEVQRAMDEDKGGEDEGQSDAGNDERPVGRAVNMDNTFDEERERQILANAQLLKELGLGGTPAVKERPQPRKVGRKSTQQKPVSERQLRSRTSGKDQMNTPEGESATPEGESATPEGESATPEGEPTTPERESATPEGESTTPEGESATPEGESATPERESATPEREPATPAVTNPTPMTISNSPSKAGASNTHSQLCPPLQNDVDLPLSSSLSPAPPPSSAPIASPTAAPTDQSASTDSAGTTSTPMDTVTPPQWWREAYEHL